MVTLSKLHPDVDDSGPHRLEDEYNNYYMGGFEGGKSISWRHQKSSARFGRVDGAWQLARACQVGSIVHTSESNTKSGMFCRDLQSSQLQISGWLPGIFFLQITFWLAGQVSHFGSGMFGGLDKLWREFEVVAAFEPCNRTNRTKTDSVLGTMWSPSYRIKCYRLNINFEQCTANLARGQQVVRAKLRRRVGTRVQYHCGKCYCGWNNSIHSQL